MFDRIGRWLRSEASGERLLFVSHVPQFQAPQWLPGEFVDHEGGVYVITRWGDARRVPLVRGGSVHEWEVWGRPATEDEVSSAVERAADRLLSEEPRS